MPAAGLSVRQAQTPLGAASLSQQELSSITGISIDNIRTYEFNQEKPSNPHLGKLIAALGEELVSGLAGYSQTVPGTPET